MPDADPKPSGVPIKDLVLVTVVGILILSGAVVWLLRGPADSSAVRKAQAIAMARYDDNVGDAACSSCHPGEAAAHAKSGHAFTLRKATGHPVALRMNNWHPGDPEHLDRKWSYTIDGGRLAAREGTSEHLVEWAFGSGQHATTFLTLERPRPTLLGAEAEKAGDAAVEHRFTYFAHLDRLDITPGQTAGSEIDPDHKLPHGRTLTVEETLRCFDCHATLNSREGWGTLDPKELVPNVNCERCHGPGKTHVEAVKKIAAGQGDSRDRRPLEMPFGNRRETALDEIRMCGQCHRLPEVAPAGSIRPDNDGLARFQPIGLLQSSCYKQSRGGLRCATCHDPHAPTSRNPADYEAACLQCHTKPETPTKARVVECPKSPRTGCIPCHMPRRDTSRGLLFSDHWIRTLGDAER